MIEFDRVTKSYPDGTTAVDSLDLVIPDGQVTVLVGPSGCGKTTTLRMINRMIEPTFGTIRIDGDDIQAKSPPELRRTMGYVIQHAGLFPHRTIIDNIATVPRLLGTAKGAARERARELMDLVGLDPDLARRYPGQLSGGQQQRVGVARALAADPPILLMDEPFSAVDPLVRDSLQQQMLDLQSRLGKTIVFVTHDIDEAIILGDQIAVFAVGGRLAQLGTPAELLAEPADDFVRSFIGRDRGIRALSFLHIRGLRAEQPPSGVSVSTDDHGRPVSIDLPDGPPYPLSDREVLRPDTTARVALDLALLAPGGWLAAVDDDGRFAGVVRRDDVLDAISAASET